MFERNLVTVSYNYDKIWKLYPDKTEWGFPKWWNRLCKGHFIILHSDSWTHAMVIFLFIRLGSIMCVFLKMLFCTLDRARNYTTGESRSSPTEAEKKSHTKEAAQISILTPRTEQSSQWIKEFKHKLVSPLRKDKGGLRGWAPELTLGWGSFSFHKQLPSLTPLTASTPTMQLRGWICLLPRNLILKGITFALFFFFSVSLLPRFKVCLPCFSRKL